MIITTTTTQPPTAIVAINAFVAAIIALTVTITALTALNRCLYRCFLCGFRSCLCGFLSRFCGLFGGLNCGFRWLFRSLNGLLGSFGSTSAYCLNRLFPCLSAPFRNVLVECIFSCQGAWTN